MSASSQAQDLKRFIGYSNNLKKQHSHHHAQIGESSSGSDQRWHTIQENQNGKKKHLLDHEQQLQQQQLNSLGYSVNPKQINTSFINEFIPQQPTDLLKKERRNKDRLQHLSKLLPQKARWIGYLDVGCGNAEISATVAQHLGIGNVFGIDMFSEDDFNQPCMDLEIKYIQNSKNKIQMATNSVDLITCFMAIHHFEQLDLMLREIQKVLLIDGYLFIREHDVPTKDKQLRSYIEEMHRKYPDHQTDGYMKLFDRDDLREILSAYGFQHLGDSDYTGLNPQAVYHSLYILKSKEISPKAKELIHKRKTDDLSSSFEGDEMSSSNQSSGSICSEDGEDLNKVSVNNGNHSTYQNKKEQYQQELLEESSSEDIIDQQKQVSPTPKIIIASKLKQNVVKNNQHSNKLIPNKITKDYSLQTTNKIEIAEEVDIYANIISIPPLKTTETKSTSQPSQKKQMKLGQPYQVSYEFNEETIIQPTESQKINIVDDDGFVVVGKHSKKQQQQQQLQKNNSTGNQIPIKKQESNDAQKKAKEQPTTLNKKQSDDVTAIEENLKMENKQGEEHDDNSCSVKESSNQFIYINQKNQKNKNRK